MSSPAPFTVFGPTGLDSVLSVAPVATAAAGNDAQDVLQNATHSSVDDPPNPSTPGLLDSTTHSGAQKAPKKRKKRGDTASDNSGLSTRQQQAEARIAALETILDAAESLPPTMTALEGSDKMPTPVTVSKARDIYYWVRPVNSSEKVNAADVDTEIAADAAFQASLVFNAITRPTSGYLRCIPCLTRGLTKVWANNSSGGVTTTVRNHQETYHAHLCYTKCLEEGLTDRLPQEGIASETQPEFSRPGLVKVVVDWVVTTDQSLNVVDSTEFRDLIRYCGQNVIKDNDIPHRDKLAAAAWAMYLLEKEKIDAEMQEARGRISLTSDLWSDPNLRSFMAATAHYIDNHGKLHDRLIAFHKIDGQHNGSNLGNALFNVLIDSNIVDKVGFITLDNAGNNNTMMQQLASIMQAQGKQFDANQNRIRCFPHVMNLAVQTILNSLDNLAAFFRADVPGLPIDFETEHYLQALESKHVDVVRASVSASRSSRQRRKGFLQTIRTGNTLRRWRVPNKTEYQVPELQLLCDVPTHWSSTYNMLQRYLDLHPAIVEYAFRSQDDAQIPVLSHKQYEVVQDVVTVLSVAHKTQELLCTEKAPTLPLAFPLYETVIRLWEELAPTIPEMSHAISQGVAKLKQYVSRACEGPANTLAMIVNPIFKMEWICKHWSQSEVSEAHKLTLAEMMKFQQQRPIPVKLDSAKRALQAQNQGYMRMLTLGTTLRHASDWLQGAMDQTPGPSTTASTLLKTLSLPPSFEELQASDRRAAEDELACYFTAGTLPEAKKEGFDIVEYWRNHQYTVWDLTVRPIGAYEPNHQSLH